MLIIYGNMLFRISLVLGIIIRIRHTNIEEGFDSHLNSGNMLSFSKKGK